MDEFRLRGIRFLSLTQDTDILTFEGRFFVGLRALVAEYELEIIRQRTKAGIAAARKRGAQIGRPKALSAAQVEMVILMREQHITNADIVGYFGVSSRTITRALNQKAAP